MTNNQWNELLTPNRLKEYGALDIQVPNDVFDPKGDWELTWRIWLLKRQEKDTNHRGYISLKKKNISNEVFNLFVEQKVLQMPYGVDHETKALIRCAKDAMATPSSWELSRRFYDIATGEEAAAIAELKTGVIDSNALKISMSGKDITHTVSGQVTSNWSMMEVLMRCGYIVKNNKFTVLDELDKIKRNQTITFKECLDIPFGARMVHVSRYDQLGEGTLPWSYYIDDSGRLLLALNGLRAYILDSAVQEDHKKISLSVLGKNKKNEKEKSKNSVQQSVSPECTSDSIKNKPNIILITTDQQSLNTISACGNRFINTPNFNRLTEKGVSFMLNYSANPLCSPARSSIFTGRTTCETGVIQNGRGIRENIPNLGQWLKSAGYETVYSGKWHVPESNPSYIEGFDAVLPGGFGGQGTLGDQAVSSASAGWLMNRKNDKPFFLTVNFLQPHDICNWNFRHTDLAELEYEIPEEELPPLPKNFQYDTEPEALKIHHSMEDKWPEMVWRYYLWSYYRMVEEVDAEIGRVLDALDTSEYADNTVIIFTADHGEGCAHHRTAFKNFLYDEVVSVPLIISNPGFELKRLDYANLTSGLDIMPTVCDFAGVTVPVGCKGISLKPLCIGETLQERTFVVTEVCDDEGRMLRSKDFKLIAYRNDPVLQLFDMKNDPGETKNLAADPDYADILEKHKQLLNEWEASLDRAPDALHQFKL